MSSMVPIYIKKKKNSCNVINIGKQKTFHEFFFFILHSSSDIKNGITLYTEYNHVSRCWKSKLIQSGSSRTFFFLITNDENKKFWKFSFMFDRVWYFQLATNSRIIYPEWNIIVENVEIIVHSCKNYQSITRKKRKRNVIFTFHISEEQGYVQAPFLRLEIIYPSIVIGINFIYRIFDGTCKR